MKLAKWDTKSGHTVCFTIPEDKVDAEHANPFKRFTKMRGDKVGTRFEMIAAEYQADNEPVVVFKDEVMLKGWTDSNSGWTVTFWLPPPEGDHQFSQYGVGDPFAVALVEINEAQEQVDQIKREIIADAQGKKKRQHLSQVAAIMCQDPVFWEWLHIDYPWSYEISDKDEAASVMRDILEIESRSELNTDEAVAQRFHRMIRRPYAAWREENER